MDFLRDMNRKLDEYLTPAVKTIFLINCAVWLALMILDGIKPGFGNRFLFYFAQIPYLTVLHIPPFIWTVLTYAFVHVDPFHLLFNMLALWFFGPMIESRWGTRYFWFFYLGTAIGGGVFNALGTYLGYLTGLTAGMNMGIRTIGASGALNAIFFAFAAYYPDAPVMLLFFPMPIKAKYMMAFMIAFDVLFMRTGDHISHTVHLAGLATGYILLAIRHGDPDLRTWRWRD